MAKGSARGIRAGKAFVELGAKDKLTAALARIQARLRTFGDGVSAVGRKLLILGTAGLAPFAAAVKHFADSGSALHDMSKRTGLAVELLSELSYAADLSGSSLEDFEKGVRRMQATIVDAKQGLSTATDALRILGLTVDELLGLSPEEQFIKIAERIDGIADPTIKAAAAMEIFGKSGAKLLPVIDGLEQARKEARLLGLTISKDAAGRADELGDAMDRMWKVAKNAAFWIGDALAPAVTKLANTLTSVLAKIRDWIQQNPKVATTVAAVTVATVALGVALVTTGVSVRAFAFIMGGLVPVLQLAGKAARIAALSIAALSTPIGLVIAGVLALGASILWVTGLGGDALDWLGKKMDEFGAKVSEVFSEIPGLKDLAGSAKMLFDVDWDAIGAEVGRVSSTVQFGGQLAAQLGATGTLERTAKAAEKAIDHLRRIEQNTSTAATYE